MSYIFISYSHTDKEYVHKLHQHLFEHNFDSWIDDRIDYGSRWSREVERRIRECSAFVLIMSSNSKESEWVENELYLARELDKPIYTLLLEGEPWWSLRTIQYLDVRKGEMPPAKFYVSLEKIISQYKENINLGVSINIGGNVQGNIVVGDNNTASAGVTNILSNQSVREQAEIDRKAHEKAEADKKAREQAELDRKARERMGRVAKHPRTWEYGTRQVVFGGIGAVLYGLLSWAFNIFPLPTIGNVYFRPEVAVLIFFSVAYGPWVGFFAGFIGYALGSAISGWGFHWGWNLGSGLMGLVAGLVMAAIKDFRAQSNIIKAVIYGLIGIAVGMLFASLMEMFMGGIDINTALVGYFVPAFLGNAVVTIVLLPILMVAFAAVAARRGR